MASSFIHWSASAAATIASPIAVDAGRRSDGLGAELVQACLDQARTLDVGGVLLVGASFLDFLRLGYHSCFGWLDTLALDPGRAAVLYRHDDALTDLAIGLRDRLRRDFRLSPVDDIGDHLRHLQARHLSDLVLPEGAKGVRV